MKKRNKRVFVSYLSENHWYWLVVMRESGKLGRVIAQFECLACPDARGHARALVRELNAREAEHAA